jgi:hypothetical protein
MEQFKKLLKEYGDLRSEYLKTYLDQKNYSVSNDVNVFVYNDPNIKMDVLVPKVNEKHKKLDEKKEEIERFISNTKNPELSDTYKIMYRDFKFEYEKNNKVADTHEKIYRYLMNKVTLLKKTNYIELNRQSFSEKALLSFTKDLERYKRDLLSNTEELKKDGLLEEAEAIYNKNYSKTGFGKSNTLQRLNNEIKYLIALKK